MSSAIAVPAYAGIPLTHRELASNVIFTTGYEYPTKTEPAVHWNELARSGSTLVILMTQRQLGANMSKLIAGGLDPDTPVAVIEWGTRADQRTVVGTAATIAALAAEQDIKPPALAVVGAVVRLREQLNWFERKPLFGRRIVITRPRAQAAEFAEQLEAWGAEVVPFPTIETVAAAIARGARRRHSPRRRVRLGGVHQRQRRARVLRTTADGGRRRARIGTAPASPPSVRRPRAPCKPTACASRPYPRSSVPRPSSAALAQTGVAGKRVLLPRAAGARDVLPQQLRELGATVEDVPTYTTVLPQADARGDCATCCCATRSTWSPSRAPAPCTTS